MELGTTDPMMGDKKTFLARLYESTGRAIAVITASALALQNVKVFGESF